MVATQRGRSIASVAENIFLCREHYRLVLRLDEFPQTEPGQFVQLSCRDMDHEYVIDHEAQWRDGVEGDPIGHELLDRSTYLRRPFSIAGRRDDAEGIELEFIHRVVGVGTTWLSELKPGDHVHLLGPLGNRFALPSPDETALLVGGGVGIPPMLYLAGSLAGRKAVAFCGALSRDLLPLTIDTGGVTAFGSDNVVPQLNIDEFARHKIPAIITTDDGSFGYRGFVTQALEAYLDAAAADSGPYVIYTCGPEPMMKRVADIAKHRGIECQVAVERAMACGMGTCQSCCIRVKKPDPDQPPLAGSEWCWRLACTDGPIFRGIDLLW